MWQSVSPYLLTLQHADSALFGTEYCRGLKTVSCLCLRHILKILAKVFSRGALESYLPRLQDVIKSEVAKWCSEPGAVDVYSAAKSLTFRIAVRVLLGLQLDEERIIYLARIFEQLMNNLFSLPIDAPLSGLRKVRRHGTNGWSLFGEKSK